MHTVVKRIGGVLIMVFAALILLSSMGGMFGIWVLKGKAHGLSTALFAPVESGLGTAGQALEKVNTRVSNARDTVSNAQEFVGQLDREPVANGAVLSAISETVGMRLEPVIDQLQAFDQQCTWLGKRGEQFRRRHKRSVRSKPAYADE
jgi:hypothetical protein